MKTKYLTGALLLILTVLFFGCSEFPSDPKFYTKTVDPNKLQTIQNFELEKYRSKEQPTIPSVLELPKEPLEKLELSLEKCRAIALENNLDLKVKLLDPTIEQENVNAERAKFEASFFTDINYKMQDSPRATSLDIQSSKGENAYTNLGVKVPLQTGGEITFALADNRNKSNFSSSTFNPSYTDDFSLSISQPLLKNAGIRTNTHSIRIAEYSKSRVDAQTKLEVISVIAALDRVYWRLYAAFKELEVRKQQYDLAKAQLERAQRFVDAGHHAQIEVKRAEAALAQSLESIIIAENSLRDRQRELKQTLNKTGLELHSPTAIIPATEPNPIHFTFKADELIRQAIDNRMEMLELEFQIAESISKIDYLRNQALPLVTLGYEFNMNGLGSTRGDSFDLLQKNKFADHTIKLQMLIPLGNEAAKSTLRQAFYQRRQILASKEARQAMIEVEVLNALDQLESNWQRILAARQSTLLEARLYESEVHQFENGLSTSTDVRVAQTNLTNAQSVEINAVTEYQIALVDLAYATGTLLGAAQIDWEPITPDLN